MPVTSELGNVECGLKICHVNAQSLIAHFDEFRHFATTNHFHVIAISETWLKPNIVDANVAILGYSIFRSDRTIKGGVE
jgi:hypothetical protein